MNWTSRFFLWLSRAMAGRHGGDQLSVALLVLYCLLMVFSRIFRSPLLYLLAFAVLIWSIWRMLSRNHEQRWKENAWFLNWWKPAWNWMRGLARRFRSAQERAAAKARDRSIYRYFQCPKCRSTLRVPKGKGKIVITCPVCHTEFTKRT
ncbi:MAG: hypothetical protein LKJ21_01490 [Oscillospiraceae bacterium]|nr:hypothetical protein [Oscillospiraceae bacterium]MCI1990551.1 hypothetical protein [Oscillospiraceae bacterium]MCI2034683.1 hypothetical protein [Oscillospiraceae bacterium]